MFPSRTSITTGLLTIWVASLASSWPVGAWAQAADGSPAPANAATERRGPTVPPLTVTDIAAPAPGWRLVGLPGAAVPITAMDVVSLDGARVLRLRTQGSYGTLVHALAPWVPGPDSALRWRWRLEQPLAGADLRRKDGDDAALKVCVMFELPLHSVPFVERSLLRLARAASSELLPAATVCYVWDTTLARDSSLSNPFSRRVRYLVADGADSPPGQWRLQQRRLGQDFLRLFGDESGTVPAVIAVAVGADADNTGSRSLAYIADIVLNQLYRFTALQSSFGANMVALNGGRPETLNLKDLLEAFVDFREDVVQRRTRFLLGKARDRAHVLVGLAIAVANIDEVIHTIRSAADANAALRGCVV